MLLEFIQDFLPEGAHIPKNSYETSQIVKKLGVHYEKIHACPNHCMLFWKENSDKDNCTICNASRWALKERVLEGRGNATVDPLSKHRVPARVLRWFPLKKRLQKLFLSSKTAQSMRWHKEERKDDGLLRHPADSMVWKDFDNKYPDYSKDPRNVRLGLASDGFNPFGNMSLSYSMWPVIVVPYNLPPWMCMNQTSFILSLLIPGPSQPGNNIDVYLQPLVDELRELWEEGVDTYDSYSKEKFTLRASLLWTINDFPAYASLSGWSTKGEFACPTCNYDSNSNWLRHSQKWCYTGHRRWLKDDHKFRKDKKSFNGKTEFRPAPRLLSGSELLDQINSVNFNSTLKRKRGDPLEKNQWKKKSIFFSLPYWKSILVRHNLDVMHIEKNVCDNIIGTLLNIEGKTKDHYKARMDLKEMNIRPLFHPIEESDGISLPYAPYTMSNKQKEEFCNVLKNVKVPDGYSSNISRCVDPKQRKIMGLKSHDCHILMQELLGVALRAATLPDNVTSSLIHVCNFFKAICSKVLDVDELEKLELNISYTLCKLEQIFPPSFFTIMIHLIVHLASEARMCGPVHYRWMYSIERNLRTLKGYVGNKACPEGSIAERYVAYECLNLCARYFNDVETRFTRPSRNNDNGADNNHSGSTHFKISGRPLGKGTIFELDPLSYEQAHRYVLFNTDEVNKYKLIHQEALRRQNRSTRPSDIEILKLQSKQFTNWFRRYINCLEEKGSQELTDIIKCLARGPDHSAKRYSGYIVNGIRFHTKRREEDRKTQNSGVVVEVEGDVPYYGVLVDIIELRYVRNSKVILFRCEWVDVRGEKASKLDQFGYRSVDLSRLFHTGRNCSDDPFVFATQAQQVFYVEEKAMKGWHVAIKTKPRDIFDEGVDLDAEEVNDHSEDNMEAVFVLQGVNLGDEEQLQ